MTSDNCKEIVEAIDAKIVDVASALESSRRSAAYIPFLEAELSRLNASKKALTAPQTPDGRKRIGTARRKRAARVQDEPTMTGVEGLLDEIVANSAQNIAPAKTTLCPHCSRPLLSIDAFTCRGGCGTKFHRLCIDAHADGCPEVKA